MTHRYQRQYIGDIQAVIFDWSGTTFDFGARAPVIALQQFFEMLGIPISVTEARSVQGHAVDDPIQALLALPRIRALWLNRFATEINQQGIDKIYQDLLPFQIEAVRYTAQSVPGLLRTMNYLLRNQYKIGSSSDYSRELLDALLPLAELEGFRPQSAVCASEVSKERPYPHMALHNAMDMDVDFIGACVKVDDSVQGIEEGLNAGMWTVAVAISGEEVGLSLTEWDGLTQREQEQLRHRAYKRLYEAGAHYVVDTIATLPRPLKCISKRMMLGDMP